jgi:hypothetical protein
MFRRLVRCETPTRSSHWGQLSPAAIPGLIPGLNSTYLVVIGLRRGLDGCPLANDAVQNPGRSRVRSRV